MILTVGGGGGAAGTSERRRRAEAHERPSNAETDEARSRTASAPWSTLAPRAHSRGRRPRRMRRWTRMSLCPATRHGAASSGRAPASLSARPACTSSSTSSPGRLRARRRPSVRRRSAEQHLLRNVRVLTDNGVEISPRRSTTSSSPRSCESHERRRHCARGGASSSRCCAKLDSRFPATPAGLGVTVAWGLPYFRRYVPEPWQRYAPRDLRANDAGAPRRDPLPERSRSTILEHNDLVVQLRSDRLDHIAAAVEADLRTARRACSRSRASARASSAAATTAAGACRRRWPCKAGIPAASRIPDSAQLFLGFTSSQRSALGPGVIANLETLPGLTDQWPDGYFRNGTTMHVSHSTSTSSSGTASSPSTTGSGRRSDRGSTCPRGRRRCRRVRARSWTSRRSSTRSKSRDSPATRRPCSRRTRLAERDGRQLRQPISAVGQR